MGMVKLRLFNWTHCTPLSDFLDLPLFMCTCICRIVVFCWYDGVMEVIYSKGTIWNECYDFISEVDLSVFLKRCSQAEWLPGTQKEGKYTDDTVTQATWMQFCVHKLLPAYSNRFKMNWHINAHSRTHIQGKSTNTHSQRKLTCYLLACQAHPKIE